MAKRPELPAADTQRQRAGRVLLGDPAPHLAERNGDAPHGAAAEGAISGESGGERVRRQEPEQQSGSSTRVAAIEGGAGSLEPPAAPHGNRPTFTQRRHLGAQLSEHPRGGSGIEGGENATDVAGTPRHRREQQRAVRQALVAWDANGAANVHRYLGDEPGVVGGVSPSSRRRKAAPSSSRGLEAVPVTAIKQVAEYGEFTLKPA